MSSVTPSPSASFGSEHPLASTRSPAGVSAQASASSNTPSPSASCTVHPLASTRSPAGVFSALVHVVRHAVGVPVARPGRAPAEEEAESGLDAPVPVVAGAVVRRGDVVHVGVDPDRGYVAQSQPDPGAAGHPVVVRVVLVPEPGVGIARAEQQAHMLARREVHHQPRVQRHVLDVGHPVRWWAPMTRPPRRRAGRSGRIPVAPGPACGLVQSEGPVEVADGREETDFEGTGALGLQCGRGEPVP